MNNLNFVKTVKGADVAPLVDYAMNTPPDALTSAGSAQQRMVLINNNILKK